MAFPRKNSRDFLGGVASGGVASGLTQDAISAKILKTEMFKSSFRFSFRRMNDPPLVSVAFYGRIATLVLGLIAAPALASLLHPPRKLVVEVRHLKSGMTERLSEHTVFGEGEQFRFSITAPVSGYHYIVNEELVRGHRERRAPLLVFRALRTADANNQVNSDATLLFPSKGDNPRFVEIRASIEDTEHDGELITTLVLGHPLALELAEQPLRLGQGRVPGIRYWNQLTRFIHPEPTPLARAEIRVRTNRGPR